ncbi:hypothetical protein PRUPE_2G213700 [Prunus persica]|uniref:Secreted protein n=1 Tax=Prunus persica TaxID=3760 RepID=A0A251QJB2_PRUPE|nr:hypothetical protein PRUPE_2G213700 [Prunus persica]
MKILPLVSSLLSLVSPPWLMVLQPSCNLFFSYLHSCSRSHIKCPPGYVQVQVQVQVRRRLVFWFWSCDGMVF